MVSNTCRDLLDFLNQATGYGAVTKHKRLPGNKQAYRWEGGRAFVLEWLPSITPYLIVKRRQAELLIEVANITRSNNYKYYIASDIARLDEIRAEIRKLNKRGNDDKLAKVDNNVTKGVAA